MGENKRVVFISEDMSRWIRPCASLLGLLLCLACSSTQAANPVSLDSDFDGLRDLDEQAQSLTVSSVTATAQIAFTRSGYSLALNESLLLRATGTVQADPSGLVTSGPEGRSPAPDFPLVLTTAPHLSLIARMGEGPWFFIGSETLLEASGEGELFLAVNDVPGEFTNNSGSYTVRLGRGIGTFPDNPDSDGDGVLDGADGAPLDPTETLDTDGDGLGNNLDPDDDNDGLFDSEERGLTLEVPAQGLPTNLPLVSTGLILQPGEFPNLMASGTMTDGANLQSSTPEGRADLTTTSLTLAAPDSPLYQLIARIGQGEWFAVGAEKRVGYLPRQVLSEETIHLGDDSVGSWEVPLSQGSFQDFTFELDRPVLDNPTLRSEVWSTREDNRVLLNGIEIGRLCVNRMDSWIACEIPLPAVFFLEGTNVITLVAGPDDDLTDPTSVLDDFQVRHLAIDFLPGGKRIIENDTHHLGDDVVTDFEVQNPEGIGLSRTIVLSHVLATGTGRLRADVYDVTNDRPQVPVYLNGTEVGTLCQRSSTLIPFWNQCDIEFDVSVLRVGENTFEVTSILNTFGYDDFLIRNVQISLPVEGATRELHLAYNERIGQYSDNSGAYQVVIGSATASDPLLPDSDLDGLPDGHELQIGTDPSDPDSDGNGVPDGEEDLDGDLLTALEELDWNTDPNLPDTDSDRIWDGIEVEKGTDPLDSGSPLAFDFDLNGTVGGRDLFGFHMFWLQTLAPGSFSNLGDGDTNGVLDARDLTNLLGKIEGE